VPAERKKPRKPALICDNPDADASQQAGREDLISTPSGYYLVDYLTFAGADFPLDRATNNSDVRFRTMMIKYLPIAVFTLAFLSGNMLSAASDSLVTAVYAKVANNYKREKLPDGSFKPEYYAISKGGFIPGIGRNASIDKVPFATIAGVVEQYLGKQEYHMANNAKSAQLLLVVKWGETVPFNDGTYRNRVDQLTSAMNNVQMTKVSGPIQRTADGIQSPQNAVAQSAQGELESELLMINMANRARDESNEHNAVLLGYMDEINSSNNMSRFAGGGDHYDDLISDIESSRYFVIISAYDFKAVVQNKGTKLLWSTRVSVQAQGNRFDDQLVTMIANASRQFGRDSGRLVRQYQRTPSVNLGELKFLGVVPDSAPKETPPEKTN
jgi:hypothetical protein